MANTIYFNGFSAKKSKYGIKLSGKVDRIIEELNKHKNDKGYINLELTERREVGKYGETHSVKVDTWEPPSKDNSATVAENQKRSLEEEKGYTTRDGITTPDDNSLPF